MGLVFGRHIRAALLFLGKISNLPKKTIADSLKIDR